MHKHFLHNARCLEHHSTLLCNLFGRKSRAPSKLRAEPSVSSCWKRSADLRRRDSICGLKSTWYWYRTHWGRDRMRKKFAVSWMGLPVTPEEVNTQNFSSNFQTSTQITESYIWHRFDLKLLTAFGFLHMLHCLPRVNACIMKIPAASTSFSKLYLLKSSWNL